MADQVEWDLTVLGPRIPKWDLEVIRPPQPGEVRTPYAVDDEEPDLTLGRLAKKVAYSARAGISGAAAAVRSAVEAPDRPPIGNLYRDVPADFSIHSGRLAEDADPSVRQDIDPHARYDITAERRTFLGMSEVSQAQVSSAASVLEDDGMSSEAAFNTSVREVQDGIAIEKLSFIENALALPEDLRASTGIIEDVAGAIGTTIATFPAYLLSPLVGIASTFLQVKGMKVQELEHAGVDTAVAERAATFSALAQAPLEAFSNVRIISAVLQPGKTWAKTMVRVGNTMLTEGGTEAAQQFPDELATIAAMNPDAGALEVGRRFIEELPAITGRAGYAGVIGSLSGGVTVSTGISLNAGTRSLINTMKSPGQKAEEQAHIQEVQATAQRMADGSATAADLDFLSKATGVEITLDSNVEEIITEAGIFADLIAPIVSPARTKTLADISEVFDADQTEAITAVYDQMARSHAENNGVATSAFYDLFSFEKGEATTAETPGPIAPDQIAEINTAVFTGWAQEGYGIPKSVDPNSFLFQEGPSQAPAPGTRGAIKNAFDATAKKTIIAFQGADVSTMLHEIAHLKLGLMTAENSEDFASIAEWSGVSPEVAQTMDLTQWSRPQLEKIAVAFEGYVREGKAPTAKLQPIFSRIREWMLKIYGSLSRTPLEINGEVKAVFDSWLAAGQERLSESSLEVDEWMRVADLDARKFDPASATYDDITWEARKRVLSSTKAKRETRDPEIRKRLTQQAKEDIDARPEYILIDKIRKIGLDAETMAGALSPEILAAVRQRVPASIRKDGANPLEFLSEFNLSGIDELAAMITNTPTKRVALAQRTGQLQSGFRSTQKAENVKLHRDVVIEELKILEQVTGVKAGEVTEAEIDLLIEERDSSQAASDVRRDDRMVKAAMAAGKVEEAIALKAVQKERISRLYDIRKEQEGRRKIDNRMARHWKSKSITEEWRQQIAKVLGNFYKIPDKFAANPGEGIVAFIERRAEEGDGSAAIGVIPELMGLPTQDKGVDGRRIPLSLEQKEQVARVADQLFHIAKTEKVLFEAKERVDFEKDLAGKIARGYDTFGIEPDTSIGLEARIRQPKGATGAVVEALSKVARDYNAWIRRQEFEFELLDDGIGGPNAKIFESISQAESRELVLGEVFGEKFQNIMAPYDSKWAGQVYSVPGSGLSWSKEQLFMVALNSGSPDNRRALMGPNDPSLTPAQRQNMLDKRRTGNDITETQLDHIVNTTLTDQERASVEQIWDMFDELYPLLNEVHKTLNGVELKKVEGRYFPMVTDPLLSTKSGEFVRLDKIADPAMNAYTRTTVYAKSRMDRTGGNQPLQLTMSVVSREISNSIHDITHQIAVRNALRIVQDGRYAQMYIDTLGDARYKSLQGWLKFVARPVRPVDAGIAKVASYIRRNTTIVGLGFKFTVAAKQVLSYSQVVDELNKLGEDGATEAVKAFQKFYADPKGGMAFANESDPFMRNRTKLYDRDAGEILSADNQNPFSGPVKKQAFRAFMSMVTVMDKAAVYPTWHAGYAVGLRKFNNDHTKAVDFASRLVRVTQPSNSPKDLSAIQRGSEGEKLLSMFQGFFNVFYNRATDTIQKFQLGKINMFELMKSFFWLVLLPASIPELFRTALGAAFGEEPEPEEVLKRVGKDIITFPTAALPIIRDIVSSASGGRRFALTPVAGAGDAVVRAIGILADTVDPNEDVDLDRARRVGVSLSGYLFGIPSAQINTTFDGIIKLMAGEANTPLALILREPKSKKRKLKF